MLIKNCSTSRFQRFVRAFASQEIERPKKLNSQYMMDGNLPFDSNGVIALPQQPQRPLVTEFLNKRGVEYNLMQEILEDKMFGFIDAIQSSD